ncbi:hypothetical protein LJR030_005373 [Rhizobium sp. LjRoot30]|uniref:hypothetical protein n=1 Tax=Rhizobium sp. LjRoot30 TaxID=3342320 RepID=UPI003ECDAB6B
MLFGQSLFQSVLERLEQEKSEEEEEAPAASAYRVRGFSTGFVAATTEGAIGSLHAERSYLDVLEGMEPPPEVEPVMPEHLLRLSPEEIAEDLALSPADGVSRLNEKRRLFAKTNHPDGVPEKFRDNATIRMTIANLMIDEALRRLGA